MPALHDLRVYYRYCVRHMINGNFKNRYGGKKMKDAYWAAAKATTIQDFLNEMGKIRKLSVNVVGYLLEIRMKHWFRHA